MRTDFLWSVFSRSKTLLILSFSKDIIYIYFPFLSLQHVIMTNCFNHTVVQKNIYLNPAKTGWKLIICNFVTKIHLKAYIYELWNLKIGVFLFLPSTKQLRIATLWELNKKKYFKWTRCIFFLDILLLQFLRNDYISQLKK